MLLGLFFMYISLYYIDVSIKIKTRALLAPPLPSSPLLSSPQTSSFTVGVIVFDGKRLSIVKYIFVYNYSDNYIYIYTSALARLRRADNNHPSNKKCSSLTIEIVHFFVDTLKDGSMFTFLRKIRTNRYFTSHLTRYLL